MKRATGIGRRLIRKLVEHLHDQDGSAVVEGAIVVPVLMALLWGVYEFSFLFYQQQLISTGVHDAARYMARSWPLPDSCPNSPTALTAANCNVTLNVNSSVTDAVTVAKNIAVYGTYDGSGDARVNGMTTSAITIALISNSNTGPATPCGSAGCNAIDKSTSIQSVKVTASFPDPSLGLFQLLHLSAPTIVVSHTERVVGPG